jgi:hypothetical protein
MLKITLQVSKPMLLACIHTILVHADVGHTLGYDVRSWLIC